MPDKTKSDGKKAEVKLPHDAIVAIFEKLPALHLGTFILMCEEGAEVPKEAIEDLVEALREAHKQVHPSITIYLRPAEQIGS